MFKRIKKKENKDICGLASECEILEETISKSITEILKLVDSINTELEENFEIVLSDDSQSSSGVDDNEQQAKAS